MQDNHSCHSEPETKRTVPSCCDTDETAKPRADYLLWVTLVIISIGYLVGVFANIDMTPGIHQIHYEGQETVAPVVEAAGNETASRAVLTSVFTFGAAVFELMNMMWVGVVLGIIAMGFLSRIPRDFVMSIMGSGKGVQGIFRAAFAGVALDLCSHGILMVGAKLYERGVTAGQLMAFLISSPWNSFSLTLILIALIGLPATLLFIALSMVVGIVTGIAFDALVARGVLPKNPNNQPVTEGFDFWAETKKGIKNTKWTPAFFAETLKIGILDSRMILRWLFLGIIIAATMRVVMSPDFFETWFGPSFVGLMVTLLAATIIEVCSEGATPIAADIINRAGALGNGFTFLMAGVATDYTEIMVLRETTKSWKLTLFLPLLTVPQVLAIGYLLNRFGD